MTQHSMRADVDRNGLEILDRQACLGLLATATMGRIGVTFDALPVILPVNFRLVDDRILFRTGTGTKLRAAACNAVVAFEVDAIASLSHAGWSVLVTGLAREITDVDKLAVLRTANIPRWARGGDGHVVEVSTEMVTGRRIVPGLRSHTEDES